MYMRMKTDAWTSEYHSPPISAPLRFVSVSNSDFRWTVFCRYTLLFAGWLGDDNLLLFHSQFHSATHSAFVALLYSA